MRNQTFSPYIVLKVIILNVRLMKYIDILVVGKREKKKSSALSTVSYPTPNTLVDRRKEKTKTKIYKIHFSKIKHLKLNKEQNKNLKPINIFLEKKILNFFFSFYVLINDEMVG